MVPQANSYFSLTYLLMYNELRLIEVLYILYIMTNIHILYLYFKDTKETMVMNTIYTKLKTETNAVILDVREDYEYKEGHIKDAVHIPLHFLEDRACEELLDLHQPIYVYCRAGVRSKVGCHILETQGYDKVYNLGAISDWPEEIEK